MPETKARLFPIALLALALGGCSTDLSTFSVADLNPLKGNDPLRQADYNYFYKRDGVVAAGPVGAAELVGPDGRCAFAPEPTYAPGPAAPGGPPPAGAAPEPVAAAPGDPINPRSNQALYFTAGPESGRVASAPGGLPPEVRGGPRGIALSMSECQVVAAAGYTDRVQIGSNERGERTVVLTYLAGDRPGIYHFRSGRLVNMERVAEQPQQPKKPQRAARTAAKKQPAR